MHDISSDPAAVPSVEPAPAAEPVTPAAKEDRPAAPGRGTPWLLIGVVFGLIGGVALTTGLFATYTFYTHTVPAARDSLQVFHELNELRQQVNQMNEDNKLKELNKVEAVRQALGEVAAAARAPVADKPAAGPAAPMPAPPRAREGPFADIDAEVERLEKTQKVLNTILDVFTRKNKESAKER
ncbi:MAG: hypothetical protein ACRC33_10475 [Gemmataceae bacterium]